MVPFSIMLVLGEIRPPSPSPVGRSHSPQRSRSFAGGRDPLPLARPFVRATAKRRQRSVAVGRGGRNSSHALLINRSIMTV